MIMKQYTITYVERSKAGNRVKGHNTVRARSAGVAVGYFRWKYGFSKNLLSVTAKLVK